MTHMVASITSAAPTAPLRAPGDVAAAALQAQLSRCQQQLGDWQACPSRKTPEGKKIIQDLETQIRNIESRISGSGRAGVASPQAATGPSAPSPGTPRAAANGSITLGNFIDFFA